LHADRSSNIPAAIVKALAMLILVRCVPGLGHDLRASRRSGAHGAV
jgi:hypothetical protein